jgi:NADH-quinone oxidoreductase subunit G
MTTQGMVNEVLADHGRAESDQARRFGALLVAGLQLADDPRADDLRKALDEIPFLVALSTHHNEVTAAADVVFPVAVVAEKAGSFTDWEGRTKAFSAAIHGAQTSTDGRVLAMVADTMGVSFGTGDVSALRSELDTLGSWPGARPEFAPRDAAEAADLTLATWRLLLDDAALQEGEPHLAATARPTEALMSATTAQEHGLGQARSVVISTDRGSVELPLRLAEVAAGTVWVPMHSEGSDVLSLGAAHGSRVRVSGGAV